MNSHFPKAHGIATVFLACSVLFLAACGGIAGITKPLTASQILANSQNPSSLKDATFDMIFTIGLGATGNVTFTGSGKLTRTPNRSDINFSGSLLGQTFTDETITDGNISYSKTIPSTSGGKWVKTTVSSSTGSGLGVDPSSLTNFGNLQNATLVGTETINGHQAYHLKGTLASGTPTPTTGTPAAGADTAQEDLWVRTDNFYPLKVSFSSTSTAGGTTSTTTATITFKTWNTGITISLPPPSDVTTVPGA